jgi:pimeloyl-ACP methyl ester carboxylesterase
MEFRFIHRGKHKSIVLIPGWATDYRIFKSLDLNFNYIIPEKFSCVEFNRELLGMLRQNSISRIALLGWSMGGFLASEFASEYPDYVEKLILVSIRKKYPALEIEEMKKALKENPGPVLFKFYKRMFHPNAHGSYFRKIYLNEFYRETLIDGLDYLADARLNPAKLKLVKNITMIHGEYDRIAPIHEALEIKQSLPDAEFVTVPDAGHVPFL